MIFNDTMIDPAPKVADLLAWNFDHTSHARLKGFKLLTPGYSDVTFSIPDGDTSRSGACLLIKIIRPFLTYLTLVPFRIAGNNIIHGNDFLVIGIVTIEIELDK